MNGGFLIGVDPGQNTGVAVWNVKEAHFTALYTLGATRAMDKVADIARACIEAGVPVRVYVEDARLRKWIPRMPGARREIGRAIGAGSVRRDCSMWEEFLRDKKIPFTMLPPKAGRTKLKTEPFKAVTGYAERCSQHARDAAMLVFGRSE